MKRQVLKFTDIRGMLNEDEMKGILGGCGGGSDITYNGGTLNTVTITAPAPGGSSNPASGYPNGQGGTNTSGNGGGGSGTGGSSTGNYGNGFYGPLTGSMVGNNTTINGVTYEYNSLNQAYANQAALNSYIDSHFSSEKSSNLMIITGVFAPPGWSVSSQGSYIDGTGNVAYGLTVKSGDLTFVYISDFVMNNVADANKAGLIGHELIHAQNIQENLDMYNNNRAQFNLNSELAGYSYQYQFAASTNDQYTANFCYSEISRLLAAGAQGGFSTSLHPN